MLFSRLKNDINASLKTYASTPGAVLLDVRTGEEYQEGHIPESINLPLQEIDQALTKIKDFDTPLFVYCRIGARSEQAVQWFKKAGYTDVQNIGGIMQYKGQVV